MHGRSKHAPKHMSLANESKPDRNSHYVDLLRSAKRLLLPHGYCDFVYSSTDSRGSPDKPDGETIFNVLRCALHINSGRIIYNFAFVALCGALQTHFHRRGRNGKRQLQRRFLRKRGAAGKCCWSAPSQSKPNGFASSPKGRAKSTARNFLITPNPLAMNFTAWLSLRGKTSPAPGEDVTAGDKKGNLARERLRGFA